MGIVSSIQAWWSMQTKEHKQNIMFIGPLVFVIELAMAYTRHTHKTEVSAHQEKLGQIKKDMDREERGTYRHRVLNTYYIAQENELFDILLKPVEQPSHAKWLAFVPSFAVRLFFSIFRENSILCRVNIPDSIVAKALNIFSGAPYKPGNVSTTVVQVLLSRLYRPIAALIFPPALKPLTMEQQIRRQQRLSIPPEPPRENGQPLAARISQEGIEDLIKRYPDIVTIKTTDLVQ
ncbi:Hypothetical protein GLP15_3282 [Giardia lamblia P15]|uniref:Uncharacterized protein n=1 Tax=Giardia intestinalis (strain P15) TaxID=658858 RepID=E1EZ30_GIAIA|nr:Hypothetical protein GLP15_3282 [Giardia lamblia P15]